MHYKITKYCYIYVGILQIFVTQNIKIQMSCNHKFFSKMKQKTNLLQQYTDLIGPDSGSGDLYLFGIYDVTGSSCARH